MEVDADAGLDVGEQRAVVEQQGQPCPLAEVSGCGTATDKVLGLSEELGREAGPVQRCGAGHGDGPLPAGLCLPMNDTPTVANLAPAATLQLFAVRTT
jgi:hypothetical protein